MKAKQTDLALGDTKAPVAKSGAAPKRRRVSQKSGDTISKKRMVSKRKATGTNGNGHRDAQCLLPLEINTESALAASKIPEPSETSARVEPRNSNAIPQPSNEITDQLFLDTVRNQVYQKLAAGEIELDIGDGFKAIEIKHKISEESQSERLLLELLNEIRAEELGKSKQ